MCFSVCVCLQGLPGPPGEKGETGDVGAMVRIKLFLESRSYLSVGLVVQCS